jgi:hypothetical protein
MLALPFTVLLAAGCGSGSSTTKLNTINLERSIAVSILNEHHVYTLVRCPVEPQQQGHTFTCEAELTVGTYPVSVTETDSKGHVSYGNQASLVLLKTKRIENSIRASLFAQRRLHAQVSCPSDVLQQKGLTFTCTAKTGSKSYPFEVREIDGEGHIHYIGR